MKIQTVRKSVKMIVRMVVGTSVTYVVTSALHNNVNPESTSEKLETVVGAAALGMVAATLVDGYTDSLVDGIFTAFGAPESE